MAKFVPWAALLLSTCALGCEPGGEASPRPYRPTGRPLSPYHDPDVRFDPAQTLTAETPPPFFSGGTLAVSESGLVIAADPARAKLYLVDVEKKSATTLALTPGDEPGRVVTRGNHAYVLLRAADALAVVDLDTQDVTRQPLCSAPRGIALEGDDALRVACASGDLLTLDAAGQELSRVWVADDLRDVGRDARGLWVSRYRSAELVRLRDDGSIASQLRPAQRTQVDARDFDNELAFAPTLATRTVSAPDGSAWMLHQRAQLSPVSIGAGGGEYGPEQPGGCNVGLVQTSVSHFDERSEPLALPPLEASVLPVDLALSPDGKRAAIVSPGGFWQQDESRVALSFPDADEGGRGEPSGGATRQLAVLDLERLSAMTSDDARERACDDESPQWEHLFPGEAEAVTFLDDRRMAVLVREPSELRVFEIDAAAHTRLSSVIALGASHVLDTGHLLFTQAVGRTVACASCHGEGGDDAHVWTFAELGPRRTQSLLGGVLASAPFHWDGEFSSFALLADEVFTRRMGGPELSRDWASALGGFVDSFSMRPGRITDAEAVERGRTLFQGELACTQCHSGPSYRSPGSFDVGTGGLFQVPSLLGVSQRLPLMHTGCAKTLRDRFDPTCGGTEHGLARSLEEHEIDDLVAFLESL